MESTYKTECYTAENTSVSGGKIASTKTVETGKAHHCHFDRAKAT